MNKNDALILVLPKRLFFFRATLFPSPEMHWLKDERNTEIRTFLDWQDRHRRKKYNISVQYSGTFALVRCTAFRNKASPSPSPSLCCVCYSSRYRILDVGSLLTSCPEAVVLKWQQVCSIVTSYILQLSFALAMVMVPSILSPFSRTTG